MWSSHPQGIIVSITAGSGSIMSEHLGSVIFNTKENLDEDELKAGDEVEFTVIPVRTSLSPLKS